MPKTGQGKTPLCTKGSLQGDLHLGHEERPKKYETPLEKQQKTPIFLHLYHSLQRMRNSSPVPWVCAVLD